MHYLDGSRGGSRLLELFEARLSLGGLQLLELFEVQLLLCVGAEAQMNHVLYISYLLLVMHVIFPFMISRRTVEETGQTQLV